MSQKQHQKNFDNEPKYNEKHLKTKIKTYKGKINANFNNNKISKEDSQCVCLSVILIDSVFRRIGKSFYLQVFLKQCKYVHKGKKMPEYTSKFLLMILIEKILMKKVLIKNILIKKILIKKIKCRMCLVLMV